ncbi:MAG: glycoside hydrolase family 2 [Clostridia bacterium]|nr:glycoside hydrolase family 2 [Clostridia bacterium]
MKNNLLHLLTKEGESLDETPWQVYPRPQCKRDSFFCLNGMWNFAVCRPENTKPQYREKILVPFAPESRLSGLQKVLNDKDILLYQREFALPENFLKDRVILHFGAADQIIQVFLNGNKVGEHIGGYDAFSFDVTDYINTNNTITVVCRDELDSHILPYGKQRHKRGGMWYTPISGIWQTVWLESVPEEYIKSIKIVCDVKSATVSVDGVTEGELTLFDGDKEIRYVLENGICHINIEKPVLWSPENPYLYYFRIDTQEDSVESYFALRTLETKIINGLPRLCLNGKPYFFHGVLDQGYFSDGIYTPAAPSCYENDIIAMKKLGFNMLRKHIKVEPEQFYYDCDRLGMVVFQDMVNNGDYSFIRDTALPTVGLKKLNDKNLHRNKQTRQTFIDGMEKTVAQLYNHPSICYWTIFNEGWGQFCSDEMYRRLKKMDSSRFIDTTSGWFKCGDSDVESIHIYFKPVKLPKSDKPIILSEFGGYSYKPAGNVFNPDKTYGYRFFSQQKSYMDALERLYSDEVIPMIENGLCGAVYTQLSDVEDETNGFLSYDRKVLKVDSEKMLKIAEKIKELTNALSLDKNSY